MMQNALRTALVRTLTGNNSIVINAYNSPMPMPLSNSNSNINNNITSGVCSFIAMALTFIFIGIINFLLHEKQSGIKNILMLSGMNV